MMEAARTSETSVDIQLRTRQYIPEDSELHTRCRENLKSHTAIRFVRLETGLVDSQALVRRVASCSVFPVNHLVILYATDLLKCTPTATSCHSMFQCLEFK
jgi:hypothetical protein